MSTDLKFALWCVGQAVQVLCIILAVVTGTMAPPASGADGHPSKVFIVLGLCLFSTVISLVLAAIYSED